MKTSNFNYRLPQELIAQQPVEPRDSSLLMVLERANETIEHGRFSEITNYLKEGDVLVFNQSRVIPARLNGIKVGNGASIEILLLNRRRPCVWEGLARPSRKVRVGTKMEIIPADNKGPTSGVLTEVIEAGAEGIIHLRFEDEGRLEELGQIALPPYIKEPLADPERYQTVYARVAGSVAAPTAGLHFTPQLLETIEKMGVESHFVSLHIGLDTFRPVRQEDPQKHPVHSEYGVIDKETSDALSRAKEEGRRIICIGTSAVRIVEGATQTSHHQLVESYEGLLDLFILPGYKFQIVDGLVTNFHLPCSTLLMLVSAFARREFIERAYNEAIARRYRFYSFGDAMLIL
jgi:S-adenosylmethionine:tRNA ribosyltransferase-isomerase